MGLIAIILAAGQGTRMKSDKAKVLHNICGRPMLSYVISAVKDFGVEKILIVTGHQAQMVRERFNDPQIIFVPQNKRLGTAHAVAQTKNYLSDFKGDILILSGDTPLIRSSTLFEMYKIHKSKKAAITILTTFLDNPQGYGRVVSDKDGKIISIVEEKDASEKEKMIKEINAGVYYFQKQILFDLLPKIGANNKQKEYYLTDSISLANKENFLITNFLIQDNNESRGVNNYKELSDAANILKNRKLNELMSLGINIKDPLHTFIDFDVTIDTDTIIYPFVIIEGSSLIGKTCEIVPFTRLKNVKLGDGVKIKGNCSIENKEFASFEEF